MVLSRDRGENSGKGFAPAGPNDVDALTKIAGKKLPEAIADEYGVLACILNTEFAVEAFYKVVNVLKPEHFITEKLRRIWGGMLEGHKRKIPVDFKIVSNYLHDFCNIDLALYKDILEKLYEAPHSPEYVDHYAQRIIQKYESRCLAVELTNSTHIALDSSVSPEDALIEAESRLRALREAFTTKSKKAVASVKNIGDSLLDRLEGIARGERKSEAIRTNSWYDFDNQANGFLKGELVVIGAPPSGGKTTTAIALAREFARNGIFTAVVSLEMTREQCYSKLLAVDAKVPAGNLTRDMTFSIEEAQRLRQVHEEVVSKYPIAICEPLQISITAVEQSIAEAEARMKDEWGEQFTGFRVIIFDYIQYLGEVVSDERKVSTISAATVRLKQLGKDKGATVFAFAQYHTDLVKTGKRPEGLGIFADCHSISKHADIVIGMHSDGYGKRESMHTYNTMEYLFLKNRENGNGTVRMGFNWQLGWVYPLSNATNAHATNDPAYKARPIEPPKWEGFEKYMEQGEKQCNSIEDNPELALAVPKGADVVLEALTGAEQEQTKESLSVPEVVEEFQAEEPPPVVKDDAPDENLDVKEPNANCVLIRGVEYAIGEVAFRNLDKNRKLKVEILGERFDDEGDQCIVCKALESVPDPRGTGKNIIEAGQTEEYYPSGFSKTDPHRLQQ